MPTLVQSPAALLKHMLSKHNLNGSRLAQAIGLSSANVNLILNERVKISIPVALRLAKYFNTAPEYWLVLQMRYDLSLANEDKQLVKEIKAINVFTRPKGMPGRKSAMDKPAPKKKAVTKKTAAKKTTAKKPGRKTASKSAVQKKATVKKVMQKKTAPKKATVKKAVLKKAVPKKTTAKKTGVKKVAQKKALPKRTALKKPLPKKPGRKAAPQKPGRKPKK